MAKLSEVLGGLLRDLADSRVAADSLSKQYAEAYGQDPLLQHFPVPRVAIRDVTLRLRFAVNAQKISAPMPQDKLYAQAQWAELVAGAVLTSVVGAIATSKPAAVEQLRSRVAQMVSGRDLGVGAALGGKATTAVARTVALLASARGSLPKEVRALLPTERKFNAAANRSVRQALREYVPATQQVLAARAALRSEIDIVVTKAELEKIPDSQIQELTVTLGTDDVLLGPQNAPPAK